jgi:hypothetical protein
MPDLLHVQLYKGVQPFGASLSSMSDISLEHQSDFATCGACVLFQPKAVSGAAVLDQPLYIATSGKLNLTAVPEGAIGPTSRLTGSLSDVVFAHVTIDKKTFTTTKIDDCTITLTSIFFDTIVTAAP